MVVDPDDYVLNTAGKVIVFNLISCNHCGDLVASTHRHDFRSCSCGKVAADGGSAYLRRLGSAGDFKELSVIAYK
jgi:DNA-directed RNA polymerase subunit N (RpoN/RPB10)